MSTVKFLYRLISYTPWKFIGAVVADIAFFMGKLVFGLAIQGFFNALGNQRSFSPELWRWIALLVLAAVARGVFMYGGSLASVGIAFFSTSLLQRNLLERVLERPGARAVPNSPGEAISRFRDDTGSIVNMCGDTIVGMIALTLFTIASIIILIHINVEITVLVFLPLTVVIAIVQSMRTRLVKYRKASRQATSELTGAIGEIFGAVQAIQVAGTEPNVVEHVDGLNERRRILMIRDTVFTNALNSVFGNAVGIGTGLIMLLVAFSLTTHLRVGDLALFVYYLSTVTSFVQTFGNLLAQYAQTKVSHERLVTLLQGAPAAKLVAHKKLYISGAEPPQIPFIARSEIERLETLEATNISYRYPDTGRGIDSISLRLTRGSITVITGRIGAGKTTFLQALLGLLPRDEGDIYWNGAQVADPASFFVPPRSAYTSQVPHLFSDPLKDNILLGLPEEHADLQKAIHTAVIERDVAVLEHGVDTLIGTRGVKLSGGQAQRAAAARMLIRDTELLVFDDLSSALDVETEQILWERLFATEQRTCLVVSHRRTVLQRADAIIVLRDGHMETEGKLEQLLETSEEMRRLWKGKIY